MTQFDPWTDHPDMDKQVDAKSAASALGELFQALAAPGGGPSTSTTTTGPDLFKQAPQTRTPNDNEQAATGAEPGPGGRVSPVPQGTGVSQPFGAGNAHDKGGHPGIDLAVPLNTQLLAAASGRVTVAGNVDPSGYGNEVEIQTPDGFTLRYGHLHGINLKVGDTVRAGQIIGTSGGEAGGPGSGNSTGAHLHFEVRTGGHPVDPTPFLAGGYQILGGTGPDTGVSSTADPKALAALALRNVGHALAGEPLEEDQTQQGPQSQQGTGAIGDNDPGAVDAFLNATKQHESGGNYTIRNQSGQSNASGAYQFLGSTWRGLGGSTANAAEASPAEQDRIARKYAMSLFQQFKSWKLVAAAWYGGPGIAQQMQAGKNVGSPQGQGSYQAYADTIQRMMQGAKK